MTVEEILHNIQNKLASDVIDVLVKSDKRVVVSIKSTGILKVSDYLFFDLDFRFVIATALQSKKGFEIYYHFSKDSLGLMMNVHVILPKEKPEIASLANRFVGANWIEREMYELYGINFLEHPNLEKLISEGNWAEGVYPYRKK